MIRPANIACENIKDKLHLQYGRRDIARIFPWRTFFVIVDIAADRLLQLCVHELFQPDNGNILAIGENGQLSHASILLFRLEKESAS